MNYNEEDEEYDTCINCGKSVFPGVSECPYCHSDPYGQSDACSYCGKTLPPDIAECPYCKNYADGNGPLGVSKPARFSGGYYFWIAVVLIVILILAAAMIARA